MIGHGIGFVSNAEARHQIASIFFDAILIDVLRGKRCREADIFEAGHVIEQIKMLKDEANHLASEAAESGIRERARFGKRAAAEDFAAAAVIVVEESDDVEQRCFSAAAAAAYGQEVSGMYFE